MVYYTWLGGATRMIIVCSEGIFHYLLGTLIHHSLEHLVYLNQLCLIISSLIHLGLCFNRFLFERERATFKSKRLLKRLEQVYSVVSISGC